MGKRSRIKESKSNSKSLKASRRALGTHVSNSVAFQVKDAYSDEEETVLCSDGSKSPASSKLFASIQNSIDLLALAKNPKLQAKNRSTTAVDGFMSGVSELLQSVSAVGSVTSIRGLPKVSPSAGGGSAGSSLPDVVLDCLGSVEVLSSAPLQSTVPNCGPVPPSDDGSSLQP